MSGNVTSERLEELPSMSVDRLLSIEAAADLLAASPWTIRKWIQEGKISSNKIGARRLVPLSEVQRIISESAVPAVAK